MSEYLYLIRCNEFVKIGISYDTMVRLAELQTGNPYQLELILQFEYKNALLVEQALHRKFFMQRVRGEWFKFTEEELDVVVKTCCAFESGSAVLGEEFAMELLRSAVSYCIEAGIDVAWRRDGSTLVLYVDGVNYDPAQERIVVVKE